MQEVFRFRFPPTVFDSVVRRLCPSLLRPLAVRNFIRVIRQQIPVIGVSPEPCGAGSLRGKGQYHLHVSSGVDRQGCLRRPSMKQRPQDTIFEPHAALWSSPGHAPLDMKKLEASCSVFRGEGCFIIGVQGFALLRT